MRPTIPEGLTTARARAGWRSVLVQTVIVLGIWYGAFRGATAMLGTRHAMVYLIQFALFPIVIFLGVRLTRAIMSSVLNPDI